jgi:hypothetical protein
MLLSLYADYILHVAFTRLIWPGDTAAIIDPSLRREAFAHGLPLIEIGVGLVVVTRVEKSIIGNLFGLEKLALIFRRRQSGDAARRSSLRCCRNGPTTTLLISGRPRQ